MCVVSLLQGYSGVANLIKKIAGGSNLSRLSQNWHPIVNRSLKCLSDLQNQLTLAATHARCRTKPFDVSGSSALARYSAPVLGTEAKKIVFAANGETPHHTLIRLYEARELEQLQFLAEITQNQPKAFYRRHAAFTIWNLHLSRIFTRSGVSSHLPADDTTKSVMRQLPGKNVQIAVAVHKCSHSYGALWLEYGAETKFVLAYYIKEVLFLFCNPFFGARCLTAFALGDAFIKKRSGNALSRKQLVVSR